jgi:hypothetical protein
MMRRRRELIADDRVRDVKASGPITGQVRQYQGKRIAASETQVGGVGIEASYLEIQRP